MQLKNMPNYKLFTIKHVNAATMPILSYIA